jgi:hypothetical protein
MTKTATKRRPTTRSVKAAPSTPQGANGNPKASMRFIAPVTITARDIHNWTPEQAKNAVSYIRRIADDLSDAKLRAKIGRVWRARLFSLD